MCTFTHVASDVYDGHSIVSDASGGGGLEDSCKLENCSLSLSVRSSQSGQYGACKISEGTR